MYKTFFLTLMIAVVALSAACSSSTSTSTSQRKPITSAAAGTDVTVTLSNADGVLKHGKQDLTIVFADNSGKPVDVHAATVNFHMPAMGSMAAMNDPVTLTTTSTPGMFSGTVNLEMSGEWQVQINFEGPDGARIVNMPVTAVVDCGVNMKTYLTLALSLAVSTGLIITACQNPAPNSTAVNTSANTDHDMSKMQGHDMSNMNHDMSTMQGRDMTNMDSDPGAAEQPYDLQFLDSMIHHHNGAIMMAKMVLDKTERPDLKTFAQKIVDDQKKEIDFMKQLREQWYSGKPPAVNMEMSGMVGGMKMMNSEHMKEMDDMEPSHFDKHFLKMMIAYHEGAITMSKEALGRSEYPEIKKLAAEIIKAQQPEIEQMKKWQATWLK